MRTARAMLGDRAAAEDVAQEAFVRLYARWRRVSRYDKPGAWVRQVAIRLASGPGGDPRPWRSSRNGRGPPTADGSPASAPVAAPNQRAHVLRYLEDLPVAEVAETMGVATSAAKVHLHRAREAPSHVAREATSCRWMTAFGRGSHQLAAETDPDVEPALQRVVSGGRRRKMMYRAGAAVAVAAVVAGAVFATPRVLEALGDEPAARPGGRERARRPWRPLRRDRRPCPARPGRRPGSSPRAAGPSPGRWPATRRVLGRGPSIRADLPPRGFSPEPLPGPAPGGFPAGRAVR